MFKLEFKKSRSAYFQKGLDEAIWLGGKWDGETMVLEIPDDQLMKAYDLLLPLFEIVGNWKSLKGTFNGAEVDPYRFILYMHFVDECADLSRTDPENCWPNIEAVSYTHLTLPTN